MIGAYGARLCERDPLKPAGPSLPEESRPRYGYPHSIYGKTAAVPLRANRAAKNRSTATDIAETILAAPFLGHQQVEILLAREIAKLDQHGRHVVRPQHLEAAPAGGGSC